MYRILIVEDDATIAEVLQNALSGWGYEVECVRDFADVMGHFTSFAPQLVLLDLALPQRSGFYWCAEMRKHSKVPIVFVSSSADNMSLVTAIHNGADDFIQKPFDLQVLVAKIQAILRRSYDFAGEADMLVHGDLVFNLGDATVTVKNERVELTRNEVKILEQLLLAKGKYVSRESLMRRLWQDENFVDDNTLTVNITRLRKKLAQAGLEDFIKTKKGMGYIIE